jgi:hypothetical protein
MGATLGIFKKLTKLNNFPLGENSPNLVTLFCAHTYLSQWDQNRGNITILVIQYKYILGSILGDSGNILVAFQNTQWALKSWNKSNIYFLLIDCERKKYERLNVAKKANMFIQIIFNPNMINHLFWSTRLVFAGLFLTVLTQRFIHVLSYHRNSNRRKLQTSLCEEFPSCTSETRKARPSSMAGKQSLFLWDGLAF